MSLPNLYREIDEMVENTALQTKTARAIVRKAGLRPAVGESTVEGGPPPRTIVDTYVDPRSEVEAWQWNVDLTGYTTLRMSANSPHTLVLWFSEIGATSTELRPADYQVMRAVLIRTGTTTNVAAARSNNINDQGGTINVNGSFLNWFEIPETLRKPLRLSISQSDGAGLDFWSITFFSAPSSQYGYSVAVQVL